LSSQESKKSEAENRPAVFDWVGSPVILGYMGTPVPDNIYDTKAVPVQGYSGVYLLQEVTDLGIVARKTLKDGEVMPPVFISWHAVYEIQSFKG
jgi:hypothetical protein